MISISWTELEEVVERNDKKRFAFDTSGTLIRAQQDHSVPVDLLLEPAERRPSSTMAPPSAIWRLSYKEDSRA